MKKWIWVLLALIVVLAMVIIILILKSTTDKISPWLQSNVDAVKNSCASDCSNNDSYTYCHIRRDIHDMINPKFSDTCYNLANSDNYSDKRYDIPKCPQIDCSTYR